MMLKVSNYIKGGWIQRVKPTAYKFPKQEKALADAVKAAGPTLGPALISMSEYLMSSFNESYQSRCVNQSLWLCFSKALLPPLLNLIILMLALGQ